MIIGILEADELTEDVIQRYGHYAETFEQLLSGIDPKLAFKTYHVTREHYPLDINECDAYLMTGSKYSVYQDIHWIHWLQQFVVDCVAQQKKLIGICFGHQLVAQALGGTVLADIGPHFYAWLSVPALLELGESEAVLRLEWNRPEIEPLAEAAAPAGVGVE